MKKFIATIFFSICGVFITIGVGAQVADNYSIARIQTQAMIQDVGANTTSQNAIQKAVSGAIERCPMIESRIQIKVGDFDNNKIRHMEAYANMRERLAKVDTKLVEKSIDTSELKSYLVVLDSKIKKFASDYAAYIGSLKESQVAVCGKSRGQFLAELKKAKTALKVVHQDALDIRSYYVSTIKPELQELRRQLNNQKAASLTPATTSTNDLDQSTTATQEAELLTEIIE
jgi:hypothetical protein